MIAENQVEKIFRMKTEESRENFMALLKDVPLDFITVTYEIIDKLSKKYHYPIQEYLYVTLTDHIYCSYQAYAIQRTKKNNHFYDRFMIHLNYFLDYLDRSRDDNQSLLDMEDHIKQSYPKAFEIGSKIYDVITQHTGLDLYKSERVYLVLHIQRLLS
ncbi:transcription antiterminator LacT [Streptococcus pneumoniae]|nr:transcription antiterminator LacT [Streptococcus pneumoniae]